MTNQMTDQTTGHMRTSSNDDATGVTSERASLLRGVRGQLDEWRLAACIAGGVFLGLVNHLVTEFWLLKLISSGEQPTRNKIAASTFIRLAVLSVVAVG